MIIGLKKLGIYDDVVAGKKEICYGLGVGHPQQGRPRWESDEEEIMIGCGNGSRITTTNQEKHPRTGKKMRKGKIVNLKLHGGEKVKDHYGDEHIIPKKAEFKINSIRDRGIEIKEIKMRIICCRFGEKFTDWHVDNSKTYD